MQCFRYSCGDTFNEEKYFIIWREIESLRSYFGKFWGGTKGIHCDEAMQTAFFHAVENFNENRGELIPYLKSLARTVLKDKYKNTTVLLDFLDEVVSSDISSSSLSDKLSGKVKGNYSTYDNYSDIEFDNNYKDNLVNLILTFPLYFTRMCESLLSMDSSKKYFPDEYVKESLKLTKQIPNFNNVCLEFYKNNKEKLYNFTRTHEDDSTWREADFRFIESCTSKRVYLLDENGKIVRDADTTPFIISGNLQDKVIYKVGYKDVHNILCDLIDNDDSCEDCIYDNPIRLTIGDSYVIQTLGGSLSIVNPALNVYYSICLNEIITNILHDTTSRLVSVGTESIYILAAEGITIKEKVIKGVPLSFPLTKIS